MGLLLLAYYVLMQGGPGGFGKTGPNGPVGHPVRMTTASKRITQMISQYLRTKTSCLL